MVVSIHQLSCFYRFNIVSILLLISLNGLGYAQEQANAQGGKETKSGQGEQNTQGNQSTSNASNQGGSLWSTPVATNDQLVNFDQKNNQDMQFNWDKLKEESGGSRFYI